MARDRGLRLMYGITLDEYDATLAEQGGVCSICRGLETNRHQNGSVRSLCVDHDHETGRVRGLLCSKCNLMVGYIDRDAQTLLTRVAEYLREAMT